MNEPSGCLPALLLLPLRIGRLLRSPVAPAAPAGRGLGRGVALRGQVWAGGDSVPCADGVVVVGPDGRVVAVGPAELVPLPDGVRVLRGAWIGPGIVDAHVHLAFAGPPVTAPGAHGGSLPAPTGALTAPARALSLAGRPAATPSGRPTPGVWPRDDAAPAESRGRPSAPAVRAAAGGDPAPRAAGRDAPVPATGSTAARRGGGRALTAARAETRPADEALTEGLDAELRGALVAVRDLGAPPEWARTWRSAEAPVVAVAGPLVTAPGGYPGRSWGAGGFAAGVADPAAARRLVADLRADGVDLVKVAVEDADGAPRLDPAVLRCVVEAAHAAGLPVTAHALTVDAVLDVLDAGVDELAHVPLEPLGQAVVDRIAAAAIPVVSTLQCHAGEGRALSNAAALHRAGVPLLYGTDLGNGGTRPGADPRELDRLAGAGLGRWGALRAATVGSARAAGFGGRAPAGRIAVGEPAAVVLLPADPLIEPAAWRSPLAVVVNGEIHTNRS